MEPTFYLMNSTTSESSNIIQPILDTTETESKNTQINKELSILINTEKVYYNIVDEKVFPSEIWPIPKIDLAKISTRKWKGQKAEVLTSSPMNELQRERIKNAGINVKKHNQNA